MLKSIACTLRSIFACSTSVSKVMNMLNKARTNLFLSYNVGARSVA